MAISRRPDQSIASLSADEFLSRGKTMADIDALISQGVLAPTQGGQGEFTVNDPTAVDALIGTIPSTAGASELPSGERIGTRLNGQQAPVVTSTPARTALGADLDNRISGLQLEMPTEDDRLLEAGRKALASEKTAQEDIIRQSTSARLREQETAGGGILGQVRANLARAGALNTTTAATQYMTDVAMDLQQEIDRIKSDEQSALLAAQAARDAKNLDLVRENIQRADELRKERNTYRQQQQQVKFQIEQEKRAEMQLKIAQSAEERAQVQEGIDLRQEERAQQNFDRERALQTIDILAKGRAFDNFEQFEPGEVKGMEQSAGLPDGTLKAFATSATKLRALEGWESQLSTDKTTGMVTAIYSRVNPDTGKLEIMTHNAGRVGERFAPSGSTADTVAAPFFGPDSTATSESQAAPLPPTFDEYLQQQEEQAGMNFAQKRRDQLRQEYDRLKSENPQTQAAQEQWLANPQIDPQLKAIIRGDTSYNQLSDKEQQRIDSQYEQARAAGVVPMLSNTERRKEINTITDNARQDQNLKDFSTLRSSYETARSNAAKSNGAGDVVLMRMIAKITDPTTGVREEEFRTFEGAQSRLAQVGINLTKRMWSGDRLTNEARRQLLQVAEERYLQSERSYNEAYDHYLRQITGIGGTEQDFLPRVVAPKTSAGSSGVSAAKQHYGIDY